MRPTTTQPEPDLDTLRSAFAAPDPAAPGLAGDDCPPPDTLWAAVRGELPPAALRAVIEHTARCAACAEDWRLAMALAPSPGATATGTLPFWSRQRLAAAAVLFAGLGGLWMWRDTAPPVDPAVYRTDPARTAPAVRPLLPEGAALPASEFTLRWSGPAGATYDLEVGTAELRVLAEEHGLTTPTFRVPAAALAGLPAGTAIYWRIEAVTPDGQRLTPPAFLVHLR